MISIYLQNIFYVSFPALQGVDEWLHVEEILAKDVVSPGQLPPLFKPVGLFLFHQVKNPPTNTKADS